MWLTTYAPLRGGYCHKTHRRRFGWHGRGFESNHDIDEPGSKLSGHVSAFRLPHAARGPRANIRRRLEAGASEHVLLSSRAPRSGSSRRWSMRKGTVLGLALVLVQIPLLALTFVESDVFGGPDHDDARRVAFAP